jgi:hypothetical protein
MFFRKLARKHSQTWRVHFLLLPPDLLKCKRAQTNYSWPIFAAISLSANDQSLPSVLTWNHGTHQNCCKITQQQQHLMRRRESIRHSLSHLIITNEEETAAAAAALGIV